MRNTCSIHRVFPLLLALSWGLSAGPARASGDFPQVWLNPGVFSHHFERNGDFREDNIGIGAEILLAPDHDLMAGSFINSDRTRTHYGAYAWRPLHWKPAGLQVSAGVAVGAFDGYPHYHEGGWFLAAMPVLAVEGTRLGANFSVVPTLKDRVHGAFLFQIKLRVW